MKSTMNDNHRSIGYINLLEKTNIYIYNPTINDHCITQLCPSHFPHLIQVGAIFYYYSTFIVYRQFEIFHYIDRYLIILYMCVCLNSDEIIRQKKKEKVNSRLSCEQMLGSYVLSQRK
jgi:hypothetical protein